MQNEVVSWKNVFGYAGSFLALLIGSGFATGQEILQYFTSYGYMGLVGALVVFLLFLYVGTRFISVGQKEKFEKGTQIYYYYGGKYIGMFYDAFSILFIYMSFIIMIAGGGTAIQQQYGIDIGWGCTAMALCTALTVIMGLSNIIRVIGKIGPLKTLLFVFIALAAIVANLPGIPEAEAIIPTLNLLKASPNWFLAALSYVGFCMLWLAAFMAAMGKEANSQREAKLGAAIGAAVFSGAVVMLSLALMAHIQKVAGTQIPTLVLALDIHPFMATLFSIIIVLGVYAAAVPLLWTVSARLAEKKNPFRILTISLALIGAYVGLNIPFSRLVNVVYVVNGYVGICLLALMIWKDIVTYRLAGTPQAHPVTTVTDAELVDGIIKRLGISVEEEIRAKLNMTVPQRIATATDQELVEGIMQRFGITEEEARTRLGL